LTREDNKETAKKEESCDNLWLRAFFVHFKNAEGIPQFVTCNL